MGLRGKTLAVLLGGLFVVACDSGTAVNHGLDAAVDAYVPADGGPHPDGGEVDALPPDGGEDAAAPADGPGADAAADGGASGATGAPCALDADCTSDFCVTEAQDFPGGYCSRLACDLDVPEDSCLPYGGDGLCLDIGDTTPFGMCFDRCDPATPDCRAQYECLDLGGGVGVCLPAPVCGNGVVERGEECDPPDGTTCTANCQGTGTAPVGDPCATAADCAGDLCIDSWPDGYCSQYDCDLGAADTSCLAYGGDGVCLDTGDGTGVCFDLCDPGAPDCRAQYECVDVGGGAVCLPAPVCGNGVVERGEECDPPDGTTCTANCQGTGTAPVGDPCVSAADCAGNFCIEDADGWPDGYCSQYDCDLGAADTSCLAYGGDGLCLEAGSSGTGVCFDRCDPGAPDCRAEYECVDVGGGQGVCYPKPVCGNGIVEWGEECDPPDGATCDASCQGTGTAPVGDACTSAADCAGNYCFQEADGWPGGYCAQLACDLGAPGTSCLAYGGDGVCVDIGDPGAPYGVCLDSCLPGPFGGCRAGYTCQMAGGVLTWACLP